MRRSFYGCRFLHHLRLGLALAAAILLIPALCAAGPNQTAGHDNWLQLGWCAYQAGYLGQAQAAFARAARTTPGSATAAVWLGAVLAARGDSGGAADWFRAVLRRHPTAGQDAYARQSLRQLDPMPVGKRAGTTARAFLTIGETPRPSRWNVWTPEGITEFILASNPDIEPKLALWEGRAIHAAATQEGVDQRVIKALVYAESAFDPGAISRVGAQGLGQLMPQTAAELGVNPRDPWQNLVGAARLLRANYEQFHSWPLTLAAYNAGGGAVRRYRGIPPYRETQAYVLKILSVYGSF